MIQNHKLVKTFKISAGFTLMELMVVISIISVLLLISYNSFNGVYSTQAVKSAANQLSYAIDKARYYAKTKGESTLLEFTLNSSNYSISAGGAYLTKNTNFDATSGKLSDDVKILANTCGDFYFYVDGSPAVSVDGYPERISSDCTITVGYEDKVQQVIRVKGNSGNVEN